MTDTTTIMLLVVSAVHKRLAGGYRRCMTGGTVSCKRHIAGGCMVDVMGKQVQRPGAVINIAVTGGTVTSR